ncbi:hypothetical protein ARHIZOSPH14_04130 [Agromyces rhizosphaerae]|uniref:Alpha-amylase n=1 Tax=Agromyces rhizosphaerae TaxID=88374 RepID=A0A9W6CP34_9MICO|nr:carbohydrate-binding module family 20 domain-containing protein [Agromyces rhizosphaerae]GLI26171.1 hypothetical protein ARHIZOSPH14_04130 [Agromyces rhizosphaerae]
MTAIAVSGLLLAGASIGTAPATASTPQPSTVVASDNGRGNVIANLFQWTWDSVASECTDSLGPAGYGYVQVSPPQEHIRGSEWWTSYQPVSYRIESKLGTRAEFASMVATCRSAGVGVIADAVLNHTTGADVGSGTGVAGSQFGVDSFPGIYSSWDFNDCRSNISNYGDRYQVQNCRLLSLQDLRTGSDYVRTTLADYLNDLISLGVSGFRIDAAKHIPAADLEAIKSKLTDPDIFWVHEVIGASGEPVQPSEYLGSGDSHEFFYARELKSRFDGQITDLRLIGDGKLPSSSAGVFVDNHDTERNGETMNYKWGAKYLLANTFLLSWPYGSPTVYSGYTWSDKEAGAPGASDTSVPDASCASSAWTCTHRETEVEGMVGFHNAVEGTAVTNWWDDGNNHIAYGRGDAGFVTLNNTAGAITRTYQTSLPAGSYCDVIASDDCSTTVTVSAQGTFTASVPAYGALALHVGRLAGTTPDPDPEPTGDTTTVYYSTEKGWSAYNIHYRIGSGSWTSVPGEPMTTACDGWVEREISADGASITAAFNDGSGTWDNNSTNDYTLSGSHVAVSTAGVSAEDPCEPDEPDEPASAVAVGFGVQATTVWGQNIFVVGNIDELGQWSPSAAVALSAAAYPTWTATIELPPGTTFEYKYIRKDEAGNVTWESGANRVATVPSSGTLDLNDTWR